MVGNSVALAGTSQLLTLWTGTANATRYRAINAPSRPAAPLRVSKATRLPDSLCIRPSSTRPPGSESSLPQVTPILARPRQHHWSHQWRRRSFGRLDLSGHHHDRRHGRQASMRPALIRSTSRIIRSAQWMRSAPPQRLRAASRHRFRGSRRCLYDQQQLHRQRRRG